MSDAQSLLTFAIKMLSLAYCIRATWLFMRAGEWQFPAFIAVWMMIVGIST